MDKHSSDGNGFAGISVGNFTPALIQAADGEFASTVPFHSIQTGCDL